MEHLWQIQHSYLIPLLPLIGAGVAGFFGARYLKGNSHWPIWIGVGISAIISITLLFSVLGLGSGHHADAPTTAHAGAEHSAAPGSSDSHNETLSATRTLFHWITAGDPDSPLSKKFFDIPAAFFFDPLTVVMLCVVCGIGFLITVFAAGYMKGEEGYFRFFSYLGLFIFMMTILVMGDNLIMLYLGWEGVGLCSYLLIGYYYEKPSARDAAKKAFLVNRIGDFGFGVGIMLCFLAFGTVSYFGQGVHTNTGLLELVQSNNLTDFQRHSLQWIPFLLMLGAFGKSAQFPLHVWLPDAMEGPTPVSALIHAATMVTAGVYMIARCGTLFVQNIPAMWTVALVGCFTALFAGAIALRQFDLKKVFAYSTVSQLGFMFVAAGCFAPVAAVFHLVTHAFFKALLFLSSGVVMHAMHGELDMRKFSGLKKQLPNTRWLMLIGCAALAGLPPLAGYFSKDEIIAASYFQSRLLSAMMLLAAFMTAYYSFRLYFRVFEGPEVLPAPPPGGHGHGLGHGHDHGHGKQELVDSHKHVDAEAAHADEHHHNPEPLIMTGPLFLLAAGAVLAGLLVVNHSIANFLGQSPSIAQAYHESARTFSRTEKIVHPMQFGQHAIQEDIEKLNAEFVEAEHRVHRMFMIVSFFIAAGGVYIAYLMHLRDRTAPERIAHDYPAVTKLLEAKFFVDEIYQNGIVEPLRKVGGAFFAIDRIIVDGIVNLVSYVPVIGGFALKLTTQRGYLQGYAMTMLIGIVAVLLLGILL